MQRFLRTFTTSRSLANTQSFFKVSDVNVALPSSITGEIIDNAIDLKKVRPGNYFPCLQYILVD